MVLNFAHRGSLTEAPENTLPAFQKAIEHGAKAIELDVQLTKDQQLIVCHDHKLTRFNSQSTKRIKDMTLAEIKEIDVSSSLQEYKGTTLATLSEVLEICPNNLLINIEIKNIPVIYEGIEEILIQCLSDHNRFHDVIISSFDHMALKNVQDIVPSMPIGMLFYYRILQPWKYAKQSGLVVTSIHPNQVYTDRELVEQCKSFGYKVFPYTVNDEEHYEKLVEYGVDGVFSNNLGVFGGEY
ncbi:glycerophosphodiester phosphodiesterase [Virgibacillus halodenitrificans]|uniref:glycerophosphodiester phosphodiesterase n=1 Tax=Virgibacillus halodenitrificans TaxID=1482 RepID=UPI00045C8966|nr:glycerophosphodiester phosphodiesterase family protein [Virgibacillus halodenitrificans]CDQ31474.1 Glycerophosphoryl diester phosphodiesterase [Virgibacillus halodenitrificans]